MSGAAAAAPPSIFTQTKHLRDAVELINKLPAKRVPVLLTRVLTHLKEQTASIFTEDELEELCRVFSLPSDSVHTLLDSFSYIYEQAAYHLLSGGKLLAQMRELQVGDAQAQAIALVWADNREAYLSNLRERSFGAPLLLDSVHYRSQVTLGTDSMSKRKDIHTILSLGLRQDGVEDPAQQPAPLCVELSPEGLQGLYESLEKIQGQLDALSDKPV